MAEYQRVPSSEHQAAVHDEQDEREQLSLENPLTQSTLDEFNRQPPAWWKRASMVALIVGLIWFAIHVGRRASSPKPQVIYATRYSDEFKYRPAASPVITEYLKDGRIRLRGATPGGVGVREGVDIPLPKAKQDLIDKKQRDEAEKAAAEQLKEEKRRARARRARRKLEKQGQGKPRREARGRRAGDP